jgi:hypothetical protein
MRRRFFSVCVWGCISMGALFGIGCATRQPVTPFLSRTALTVARVGDTVTLSWPSEKGKTYRILRCDSLTGEANWEVLPGAENLAGTGDFMSFPDTVGQGVNRYYRLRVEPPDQPQGR